MADESIPYNLCSATPDEAEILNEKMDAFNGRQLSFCGEVEELENYVIKDKENIIAGIKICLYFRECMFISVLFVDEQYRGKGLGSWLLQYAEDKAKSIGIKLVHLDTFDFQAKDFYFKHGYEIFGVLHDCPKGHKRYYLKKILN
jgi:GNAT superfamily N-acetyltransferase